MTVDIYYMTELNDAASQLRSAATTVVVRGNDKSCFVYAELNNHAIELSKSREGWWVELWENEQVVAEHTYVSCIEAVLASKSWLA